MREEARSWLLDTIRAILIGNYSIEGEHEWKLFSPNESPKRMLICTSIATREQVYKTEIMDTSIPDISLVLNHVITAYRSNGQFYARTQLYSEMEHQMTITTCL